MSARSASSCSRARTASSTSLRAVEAARRRGASCCWHGDAHGARRRRGRRARRVRARRLPAHRRDRPLLAGDGRGRRASPPPAVRSSASATASRCSPRRACSRARCRRTRASSSCARPSSCGSRRTPIGAHQPGASRATCCASRSTTSRATTCATPTRSRELRADDRIVVRYVDNPNGSLDDIAGICNEGRQRRRAHAAPRARVATRCSARPTASCCCSRSWRSAESASASS